ncbi:unnamed protein product [Ceutorhynchus assimilis]|uniref:protein-serine/threonine phosphatase n=1 Tax=Ceutorhynchus assimilis TaxID=467358 RepID=A0A9N9MAN3_9CUCU|nr:unnamed protein product [Ceutorhynchus assimilis]
MGSYLSKPITEKISLDKSNDKLVCGSSSMQGWRISQEDAHNTILDYDENTSFFAVFDGHGGHEVAKYCEQLLPQFIKETEAYKEGNVEKALIDGFLGFDATLAQPEVIAILKEMAGKKDGEEDSAEEENMSHLFKEASQPIVEVLQKYGTLDHASIRRLRSHENQAKSPMINAKKEDQVSSSSSSYNSTSYTENGSTSKAVNKTTSSHESEENANEKDLSNDISTKTKPNEAMETENKDEVNGSGNSLEDSEEVASKSTIPEITVTSSDSSETKETNSEDKETNSEENEKDKANNGNSPDKNQGVEQEKSETPVSSKDDNSETQDSKGIPMKNGEVCQTPNKSKGKSPMKKPLKPQSTNSPIDAANQLFKKFLESEDIEDTDDESFVEPDDSSSDEEDTIMKGAASDEDSTEGEDEADDEAEDEDVEEEEDERDDDDEDEDSDFTENIKEEPGSDSGCTAVVAILKGCDLYVANAGDSRCIICRNGEAIDMSADHKPEEWLERSRIQNAGGKVTNDGRVNGGLNLSRAIGDHAYKQNKELSDKEQMITALPDVKKVTINPAEDEFMVLACDGIWNFMTSQEVVDFVRANSANKDKLSQICEEMFDHCLAPDTLGDGTGCDNMTAIIVRFNNTMKKRAASPQSEAGSEAPDTKRQKTEEEKESAVSSSSAASSSSS